VADVGGDVGAGGGDDPRFIVADLKLRHPQAVGAEVDPDGVDVGDDRFEKSEHNLSTPIGRATRTRSACARCGRARRPDLTYDTPPDRSNRAIRASARSRAVHAAPASEELIDAVGRDD